MSYRHLHIFKRVGRSAIRRPERDEAIVIRAAGDADRPALLTLAALDGARPLTGPALIAQVDGRPWAALGLDDERAVADPFTPSAAAVRLLRLRASQLSAQPAPARAPRPRWLVRRARSG